MARKSTFSYVKNTTAGKLFDIFNVLIMLALFILFFYPFWNQLVLSFNSGMDAVRGGVFFWPRDFSLGNYQYAFGMGNIWRSVFWSVLRVLVGTLSNLFVSGLFAYIISLPTFPGRKFMRMVVVFTMYIPIGLIPQYILFNSLGLLNSFSVYWLPSLVSGWNILMISSYMHNQPYALIESSRLDGAREMQIYWRIIMPICLPVFAAMAVIVGVGQWNAWFDVMVFNAAGGYDTLQMYLRRILLKADLVADLLNSSAAYEELRELEPQTVRAAVTMIVTIPIVCIYPFMQKYFVTGVSIGAVKE